MLPRRQGTFFAYRQGGGALFLTHTRSLPATVLLSMAMGGKPQTGKGRPQPAGWFGRWVPRETNAICYGSGAGGITS